MGLFDSFSVDPEPPKNPAQELHEAIRKYLGSAGQSQGLLMDWVVVTSQHVAHEDGSSATNLAFHSSENMALHRVSGLIRYADVRIEEMFRNNGN